MRYVLLFDVFLGFYYPLFLVTPDFWPVDDIKNNVLLGLFVSVK